MRLAVLAAGTLLVGGCLRFSPFEINLSEDERDQTAKNLAKLSRVDRPRVSPDHPLAFAFLSDSHDGYNQWSAITSAINARHDVELVVHSGDFTDFGTQQEYRWAYGVFKDTRAPIFIAPGNHDGLSNGSVLYSEMFGPTDFDFTYAGVHFLILNTNTIEWDVREPDLAWLERTASEPGYAATIVVTHQPPFSEPDLVDPLSTRFEDLVVKLHVTLYLYGHLHEKFTLERLGETAFVKTQTVLDGSWMIVHTDDGAHYRYESCNLGACKPAVFDPDDPGVQPTAASRPP